MSLILHLETATTVCSVALSYEGKLLFLKEENNGYTHAEHLTLFIEEVMQSAGKSYTDLDAVAVSKGPGSYTGLRIGVATAKGLCFGLGKPLVAINTLHALAKGASLKHKNNFQVCPMLDARRMEVYTALYDKAGNTISATEALILSDDSLKNQLDKNEILFVGDGAIKFKEICKHQNAHYDLSIEASAAYMIDLAYEKFNTMAFEDLAYFEPFYLKEFYTPSKQNIS